ncbi:hypothetical protein IV203_010642 [Nitzschia inconspicua]|uniref:Uncharacterized protein n=1 Tax=Nitzschia inconspicua TaxID=303405 RepID=A0A9K3PKZ1_9STRA|nr:hypothetical protein IV203_010642 [Nitzschia inconspicua]
MTLFNRYWGQRNSIDLERRRGPTGTAFERFGKWRRKPMVWKYLDAAANPLGLPKTPLETFVVESDRRANSSTSEDIVSFDRVHVLDMQGIAQAGLDISHVVACDVLDVGPCPEGWLDVSDAKGKSGALFNTTKATIKKN